MARTTLVVRARQCAGRSTVVYLNDWVAHAKRSSGDGSMARLKDVALTSRPFSATGRQEACARASRADEHRGSELWRPLGARWFGGGSPGVTAKRLQIGHCALSARGIRILTFGSRCFGVVLELQDVSVPANRFFLIIAWMPQLPSTTCVTPKSTPMDMSEIDSSSVSPFVVIKKLRILRNASLNARSIEDFL